eukprot:CAMPEP_0202957914 /NCGR_PEP_ID=MMETSP1396-20130829/2282_1 /ASSEMBLY_ACC=CAM_ASM_000872 /TAXON_ID= /ORGANISM="Pseudokeronopsis sp., Strain Brazil" /LENGTH=52 /DNA_ID=CAMNT_0049675653 /DNA_START=2034 /DNA_END=2192 /DNA_ORIENTATION=-
MEEGKVAYPIKISIGAKKSRWLYFDEKELAEKWFKKFVEAAGIRNIHEFYEV